MGRGTRIPEGIDNILAARARGQFVAKDDCILLDFVDATCKHSLVTLPTLFGMGKDTDLRGKSIVNVVSEIEQVRQRNPLLDLSQVTDINQLQSYATQVDLFQVNFPHKIIQLTQYQWHRTGEDAYVLALIKGESVVVIRDILGRWYIKGYVNGNRIDRMKQTFEEAIREADFVVGLLGGHELKSLLKRENAWGNAPPTPAQIIVCKRLGIVIPAGATKGEVAQKMSQVILARKQQRAQVRAS